MSKLQARPGILDIQPYIGGESAIPGVARVIKLASNESALGASPAAVAAIRDAVTTVFRYPDGSCEKLRLALGTAFDIDPARIVCGAGSDEIITLLCRTYAGPGDEVLYTEHGFLMYAIAARGVGATPVAAPETNLTADVDALLRHVTPRTRIVFIANPNNPTGSYLPADELARLRAGLPPSVLLVIDAAYAEYIDAADYTWGGELVDGPGPTVVTRTFSKIYGLGGLRLGWGYCPPEVADALNRLRNPFNVSSIAQTAGLAALGDQDFVAQAKAHNARVRAWSRDQLLAAGFDVPPSHGNFLLVRFPREDGRDALAADKFLRARGLIARRMAAYRLPDCLRITVGLEDEMAAVVAGLTDFSRGTDV
ncbi:MAG: histidinol-phosphate transaminase [Defluviicoccus sp.]|nr:histidinol-phosphate transaminase [Defluviicoccus sp.]